MLLLQRMCFSKSTGTWGLGKCMTLNSELNETGHLSWLFCFYSSTLEFWSMPCAQKSCGCQCLLLLGAVMCSSYGHWLWRQTTLALLTALPLSGWAILEQLVCLWLTPSICKMDIILASTLKNLFKDWLN